MKFTNISDGTGETLVKKVDVTAFTPSPGIHLKIRKIHYAVRYMGLQIFWDATTPVTMMALDGFGNMNFHRFGGLTVPLVAGATGSILFTTYGAQTGYSYDIILEMTKNVMA